MVPRVKNVRGCAHSQGSSRAESALGSEYSLKLSFLGALLDLP